jgi:hypothetical protein
VHRAGRLCLDHSLVPGGRDYEVDRVASE